MKRTTACLWAIVPMLWALALVPARAAADVLPAGDAKGAWVIRQGPQEAPASYDVAAKAAGEKWKWVARGLLGTPVAAVALDGQLHVLLTGRDYVIFDRDADRPVVGLQPNHPRWPDSAAVVSACPAGPLAGVQAARTIILVLATTVPPPRAASGSRPAATAPAPASRATIAPAPETLVLFCLQGGRWTCLDDVPVPAGADDRQVLAACLDGQLYLLFHGPRPAQMLVRDRTGTWLPPRAMPDLLPPGSMPLALTTAKDSLLLVLRHDAQGASRAAAVEISLVTVEKDLKTSPAAPIPPEISHARAGVRAIAYADGVALVWPQVPAPGFASCDPNARVNAVETIDLFAQAPADDRAKQLVAYFFYALLAAAMVGVLLQMRTPRTPFLLPMRLRPARILRRMAACLIDLLPFTFLTANLFPFAEPDWPDTQQETLEFLRRIAEDPNIVLATVAALGMHAIYTCLLEARFGTTLGKRLMGLWVVAQDGRRPRLHQTLLRAVMRILETSAPGGLPIAIACLLFTRYRQRVGDLLARTAVVEYLPQTPAPPTSPPTPPV